MWQLDIINIDRDYINSKCKVDLEWLFILAVIIIEGNWVFLKERFGEDYSFIKKTDQHKRL